MAKRPIDIQELLVWAYRDQAVDEAPRNVSGPGVALMRWDVPIDGSDIPVDIQSDAYAVDAAVRRMSRLQAALVIGCAKTAQPVDWMPGARLIMAAVVNDRGNPAGIYDEARNRVGHRVRQAVEMPDGQILYGWSERDLAAIRVHYSVWREALVALVNHLRKPGMLEGHDVCGPDAPIAPWIEDNSRSGEMAA